MKVTGVNDPTPAFAAGASQTFSLVEEAANGTVVGSASATDADLPGDALLYSVVGGNAEGGFAIDSSTGQITIADASVLDLDFDDETDLVARLTVQVSDGVHLPTQALDVKVTPLNEHAPAFTTAATKQVPENTTVVMTVQAIDADLPEQVMVYSITGGADANQFVIDSATGALAFKAAPDYENPLDANQDNVYVVEITADDQEGMTALQAIQVTVNGTVFTTPSTAEVPENTTAVMTVQATDADLPAQVVVYSISGGADGNRFTIDGASGALAFKMARLDARRRLDRARIVES